MMVFTFRRSTYLIALFLLTLLFVVSCARQEPDAPTDISVRLKWLHQTQFAGIYVAEREGYYAAANLNVSLDTIDFEDQLSHAKIVSGENTFGIGTPDELIIARQQGHPVKAIAVIYRLNPLVYISPGDSGIHTPSDLVGRTIGISPGQGTWLYNAMISRAGVDPTQINAINTSTYDIYECWATTDACVDYATNGLVRVQQDGSTVNALWPSDYGINFYADVLFTTDEYIAENAEVVQRFIDATLQGWNKAIENPALGTQHTLSFDETLDYNTQLAALNASIPLIDVGYVGIGYMEPTVWQEMMDLMIEQGILDISFDVTTVYTNEFVSE